MPRGDFPRADFDGFEDLERERQRRRRTKSKTKKTSPERDDFRPRPTAERKRPRRRDWLQYLDEDELAEELDDMPVSWSGNQTRRLQPQYMDDE